MDQFPPALSHGRITEVFPDVFFVSGAMETQLQGLDWEFSRNMTVVRDDQRLVIINSIRLDDEGLRALEALGNITDVVRLGCLHGRDDHFYVDRYQAAYWALPGIEDDGELKVSRHLTASELPIADASLFEFKTTQFPEGILRLEREGGIAIACDALQNWHAPDEYFSEASTQIMTEMNFFTPANLGPVWLQAAAPDSEDFIRLKTLQFKHALCGHGQPLLHSAQEDFHATFNRVFSV